jgi:hypothetical protein
MPFAEAAGHIVDRYRLTERDGALSHLQRGAPPPEDAIAAANRKDEAHRVIVKVVPRLIRAWDFSKAPFGLST